MKHTVTLMFAGLAFASSGFGYVSISSSGQAYTQDFASLNFSSNWDELELPPPEAWVQDTTLPGWSVTSTNSAVPSVIGITWGGEHMSGHLPGAANDGTHSSFFKVVRRSIAPYSAGTVPNDGDNRIGTRTGFTPGNVFFTLTLRNQSGKALDSFALAYQAAQFYVYGNGVLWVQYSLDGGSNWTKIDALTYTAPVAGAGRGLTLAEIDASIQDLSAAVGGLNWANGSDLLVRWAFWRDIPGGPTANSPVMTIDNVAFIAEPVLVEAGLEKSTDGGATWQPAAPGPHPAGALYRPSVNP